jgi:hypothetical protein
LVRAKAATIRKALKCTIADMIEAGQGLCEVKRSLPHGKFGPWLHQEFELTERTAQRFMRVAERLAPYREVKSDRLSVLVPEAAYLLSAKGTPDAVIDNVMAGKIPPSVERIKQAIEDSKSSVDERPRPSRCSDASIAEALIEVVWRGRANNLDSHQLVKVIDARSAEERAVILEEIERLRGVLRLTALHYEGADEAVHDDEQRGQPAS